MKELENQKHYLIMAHRNTFIAGLRMMPFDWNYFFGSLIRNLLAREQLSIGLFLQVRVRLYSLFYGFTEKRLKLKMEKEFKGFLNNK